jgi:hypothetical protein
VAISLAGIDSIKEIIYIYGDNHNHCFITSGINYKEFVQGLPFPLQNILLLKHDIQWSEFNLNSSFYYVEREYINQFILEHSEHDDLCWIDFEELADLDELEPKEIAELLYLAHKKEPLQKPFIPRLNNSFAYMNISDGMYQKVYYKRTNDFIFMLCNVISYKITQLQRRSLNIFNRSKQINPINIKLMLTLYPLMEDGLVIDLSERVENRKVIEIPIFRVDFYSGVDEILENVEEYRELTNHIANLTYSKKDDEWSVVQV